VFAEGAFEPNCVLYIRNCEDCSFVVNVHSAKGKNCGGVDLFIVVCKSFHRSDG
jgi:hypothetical protein